MKKSPFKDLADAATDYSNQLKEQMKEAKLLENPLGMLPKKTHEKTTNQQTPVDDAYDQSEIDTIMHNIFTRRCVRHYLSKDVHDSTIIRILDAGRQAPSAGNYQPWEYVIIRDPKSREHIVEACFTNNRKDFPTDDHSEDWMLEAPVLVVVTINQRLARGVFGERGEKLYGIQSVAASIENILLAANAYGLGTCWVGAFSEERIAALIGCPRYMRPCAVLTIGWPADNSKKPKRHPLGEFVHIEKFGRTPREKMIRPREQLF
jgi:nitroreductase